MAERRIGLLGATGLVGECLLTRLKEEGREVVAFSRRAPGPSGSGLTWHRLPSSQDAPLSEARELPLWICLAPIWVLVDHFPLLEFHGARRVVALSSTSRDTKADSADRREYALAQRLREGEDRLHAWAAAKGIEWIVLRPTLIYGFGKDKNISEMVRFIRRFGFFPVFGKAAGLRQPVHVQDVAAACLAALESSQAANRTYQLSGAEVLPYHEMVARVFAALGRRPRLLRIPFSAFRVALVALRALPRYRHWSPAMAMRMNQDLVFDHEEAARDLKFSPRPFQLGRVDLPA